MKKILWSEEKNIYLQKTRGISFEEIEKAILSLGDLTGNDHYNPKYAHQRTYIVKIHDYTFVVPFVESEDTIFLKTAFPSRKYHYKK